MSVMPCHATNECNKDESAAKVYLVQLVGDGDACRGREEGALEHKHQTDETHLPVSTLDSE